MQTNSKNYIVGGGITGLIWAFYNPSYTIITPETGGMFGKTNLIWLHDTSETRKLLKDLGWENPSKMTKKSYIGYYRKGWIYEYQTLDMNLVTIQKKMTEWNKPVDKTFTPKTRDLSLSVIGGANYMNTLDVDLLEVVNRLSQKARMIQGIVSKINDKTIEVQTKNGQGVETTILEYENIVSSIPAPFFWKGFGQSKEFKGLPTTNIITPVKPETYDNRYEMVYYDDTVPYSRVSFLGGKYAIEFTGIITKDEFVSKFPDLIVEEYFVVPNGRIFESSENISPGKNIIFSGRFAQWKYGITVEWVVKQVMDQLKIWKK